MPPQLPNALTTDYPRVESDFEQILALQQANLPAGLSATEQETQGFVTAQHDLALLKEMNAAGQHSIVRFKGEVVGYALCMHTSFRKRLPVLVPLFTQLDQCSFNCSIDHKPKAIAELDYFVMGQVCIAKDWRAKGLFDLLYKNLRHMHAASFDAVVTDVAQRNQRSIRAHQRVGFETFHSYKMGESPEVWEMMIWDWR